MVTLVTGAAHSFASSDDDGFYCALKSIEDKSVEGGDYFEKGVTGQDFVDSLAMRWADDQSSMDKVCWEKRPCQPSPFLNSHSPSVNPRAGQQFLRRIRDQARSAATRSVDLHAFRWTLHEFRSSPKKIR